MHKLNYGNYLELSDDDYRNLTIKMLEFIDKGKYSLINISYAFDYATRFGNILSFDIHELVKRFEIGIQEGLSSYEYDPDLAFKMPSIKGDEHETEKRKIFEECILINQNLENKIKAKDQEYIVDLFFENLDVFIKTITHRNSEFILKPIFNIFDFEESFNKIYQFNNKQIVDFIRLLIIRYGRGLDDYYKLEMNFFKFLEIKLDEIVDIERNKTLKEYHLNSLLSEVKKVVNNLESWFHK